MYVTPETLSLLQQDLLRDAAEVRLARLARQARECCRQPVSMLARATRPLRSVGRAIAGAVR
jgi:hypothetical protein